MRLKIRELRKKHGYTLEQAAKKIGISRSQYGQIEVGDRGIRLPIALKMKKVFGYYNDDLFDNTPEIAHPTRWHCVYPDCLNCKLPYCFVKKQTIEQAEKRK